MLLDGRAMLESGAAVVCVVPKWETSFLALAPVIVITAVLPETSIVKIEGMPLEAVHYA